jgi:hypothetical protein
MTQWRIRLAVPEADVGKRALRSALAQAPVTSVRLDPSGAEVAELTDVEVNELTSEVIIELEKEEALGDLLRALHEISPQVFISRVGSPEPEPDPDQPIRVRKLAPIGAVHD